MRALPPTPVKAHSAVLCAAESTMTVQSNPRKLYQSGNGTVVSLPDSILEEADLERGDRVVLTADGGQIELEEVSWQVSNDE